MAAQKQSANETNGFVTYEWKITGDLLKQFKIAQHKQEFQSMPFSLSSQHKEECRSIWKIQCYPHGDISPDHMAIYLFSYKLNKEKIAVNFGFEVGDWSDDSAHTFQHNTEAMGFHKAFNTNGIKHADVLVIRCFVEETMNVSVPDTYFEWNINNYFMSKWKNAKFEEFEVFSSPTFNAIGSEWYLEIYPNGKERQGEAYMYLYIEDKEIVCNSPFKHVCHHITIEELRVNILNVEGTIVKIDEEIVCNSPFKHVCHHITIEELRVNILNVEGTIVKIDEEIVCNSPFKHGDIQNKAQITICIKIWEKGSIEDRMMKMMRSKSSETIHNLEQEKKEIEICSPLFTEHSFEFTICSCPHNTMGKTIMLRTPHNTIKLPSGQKRNDSTTTKICKAKTWRIFS
eukprot:920425_1